MRALNPSDLASRTARPIALMYPALVTPVVLLLVVTAFVRGDRGLLAAAVTLVVASLVAGAISGFLVLELAPADSIGLWLVVLLVPPWLLSMIAVWLRPQWLHSLALDDALSRLSSDYFVIAVGLSVVAGALLLGFGLSANAGAPVVLRHRRAVVTDRTIGAFGLLFFTAVLSMVATRRERWAFGEGRSLAAQLPVLQREAERYPTDFRSQYLLGNALVRTRDCAHAVLPLRRAVALDADDGWAQNDLGFALSCLRRYNEAAVPYMASVRLMPNERRARYGLAWALEQSRDSTAERQYHAIRALWPDDPFAMAREATLRYNRGERDEGLQEMRRALALGDTSYWVRLAAAQLFSSAALLEDALAQYRVLAQHDSSNLWIWAHYGSAAYLAGELEEARKAFDHADSVNPRGLDAVSAWRDMRDAARAGVPPSKLPPIQPRGLPKG